jgi:hypothetical protein
VWGLASPLAPCSLGSALHPFGPLITFAFCSMIRRTLTGRSTHGIWIPCDAYLGIGRPCRAWDVPTICRGTNAERHCYVRLEWLGVLIILDFRKVSL